MRQVKRPNIGTKMYFVCEHLWKDPDYSKHLWLTEYCVVEGEVTGFIQGGYTEIQLTAVQPGRGRTPFFFKLNTIGVKIFYTPKEAALLAQKQTEDYELVWGWTGDPPLRRSWEKYLE